MEQENHAETWGFLTLYIDLPIHPPNALVYDVILMCEKSTLGT